MNIRTACKWLLGTKHFPRRLFKCGTVRWRGKVKLESNYAYNSSRAFASIPTSHHTSATSRPFPPRPGRKRAKLSLSCPPASQLRLATHEARGNQPSQKRRPPWTIPAQGASEASRFAPMLHCCSVLAFCHCRRRRRSWNHPRGPPVSTGRLPRSFLVRPEGLPGGGEGSRATCVRGGGKGLVSCLLPASKSFENLISTARSASGANEAPDQSTPAVHRRLSCCRLPFIPSAMHAFRLNIFLLGWERNIAE